MVNEEEGVVDVAFYTILQDSYTFSSQKFKDFPGPYVEISRTLRESNERALGTKTTVFSHFVSISRMLYLFT